MPITKSAKKALRQNKRRRARNFARARAWKEAMKNAKKNKTILELFKKAGKVQRFVLPKREPSRDPLATFLFGCANAWVRNDRGRALQSANAFFEHGGSPEQLLGMLAAYAKKTKKPHGSLRTLRDQFIAARLEKADLRFMLFAFLAQ